MSITNMEIADKDNYYQGAYGFLNGFKGDDPLESLNEMAQQNINLVILYGTYYYVKTDISSKKKDAILEKQFKKIDRYLARALALGIKVIMPIWRMPEDMSQVPYLDAGQLDTAERFIQRYKDNPALLGWYLMDEPILRLEALKEKAPEYFEQYVIPALDTLSNALDKYDTSNKVRFGVFARYNKGKYGLNRGAEILIDKYLTLWGHDQYPFIKKSPEEFSNIYYVIKNLHVLNRFVRRINKPFLFVGQAQSFDADSSWQQRMPTEQEFLVQQVYPMLLMSDEQPRHHLGNLVWAFGVMRSTAIGRKFLANEYTNSKKIIDIISTGIAHGRIKDISQDRYVATYEGEKRIKAGIYNVPQDSLIFHQKTWKPHPYRGKKMAVAIGTRGREEHNFSFTYPGKVTSVEIPFAQDNICTIRNFEQKYNFIKQETVFQMQIKPLCPTVLIFDTAL